jgi:hypothetical protein
MNKMMMIDMTHIFLPFTKKIGFLSFSIENARKGVFWHKPSLPEEYCE